MKRRVPSPALYAARRELKKVRAEVERLGVKLSAALREIEGLRQDVLTADMAVHVAVRRQAHLVWKIAQLRDRLAQAEVRAAGR